MKAELPPAPVAHSDARPIGDQEVEVSIGNAL